MRISGFFLLAVLALGACTPVKLPDLAGMLGNLPAMRWDARPEAAAWTHSTLMALTAEDAALAGQVPQDVAAFCPGYAKASLPDRRAFWAGLLSATAKYESGFNPAASAQGRYIGLMQISPKSAGNYGCTARTAAELKDGEANLACAVRMVAAEVGRDGVVAGKGSRGIGRAWMPFRKSDSRAEIARWTAAQSYCQG